MVLYGLVISMVKGWLQTCSNNGRASVRLLGFSCDVYVLSCSASMLRQPSVQGFSCSVQYSTLPDPVSSSQEVAAAPCRPPTGCTRPLMLCIEASATRYTTCKPHQALYVSARLAGRDESLSPAEWIVSAVGAARMRSVVSTSCVAI